jgi:hypothetical protein
MKNTRGIGISLAREDRIRGDGQEVHMDWARELSGMLGTYGNANPKAAPPSVHDDFDAVARSAPAGDIADGIAAAFRSDHTPPFGDMLGQLFGQSAGSQRAGILNTLIAAAGPAVVASVLGRFGAGNAGKAVGAGGAIDETTAAQIPPGAVTEIAAAAEKKDPSIVDRVSQAYAQQPQIVKTLGKVALTVALAQMAQKQLSR